VPLAVPGASRYSGMRTRQRQYLTVHRCGSISQSGWHARCTGTRMRPPASLIAPVAAWFLHISFCL
jgi:hypothetical protein